MSADSWTRPPSSRHSTRLAPGDEQGSETSPVGAGPVPVGAGADVGRHCSPPEGGQVGATA
ncbi:MAG: hypothetical protein M0T80_00160, partial [Actinomycetota bacterium]|nr:hypothetical protein [Actinomycetota bacterium]